MINLTDIGIFVRGIGLAIMAVGVLPKAHFESKVPNGLGKLRRLIFKGHLIFFLSQLLFILLNIIRQKSTDINVELLSVANSISFLLIAVILHLIYHMDYGRVKH